MRAVLPRGETLSIPSIRIRPAASLSWLRLSPAFVLDVDGGGLGNIRGDVLLGRAAGFDGKLESVNLALLPLEQLVPDLAMDGGVDALDAIKDRSIGRAAATCQEANKALHYDMIFYFTPGGTVGISHIGFDADLDRARKINNGLSDIFRGL